MDRPTQPGRELAYVRGGCCITDEFERHDLAYLLLVESADVISTYRFAVSRTNWFLSLNYPLFFRVKDMSNGPTSSNKNIHTHRVLVDQNARSKMKGQRSAIIWLTGISGAGKSTIASLLESRLAESGIHTYLLDGDSIRRGLSEDLSFSDKDRRENLRRVAEVSKLMVDAGLVVLTAFISPFREDRERAKDILSGEDFVEIHVHAPIEVAERRDVKGLYSLARNGTLKNFTGIDSPYEVPEHPDLKIDTHLTTVEQAVTSVLEYIAARGIIYLKR